MLINANSNAGIVIVKLWIVHSDESDVKYALPLTFTD